MGGVSSRRRLLSLLAILAVLALPAVALRAACVGRSCPPPAPAAKPPAFCTLPVDARSLIAAGFRDGRSPDVLAFGDVADEQGTPWTLDRHSTEVPVIFLGPNVRRGRLEPGVGVDRIAPTLARAIGLRRPHPETRSGVALEGVVRPAPTPRLIVVIAWRGVGTALLDGDRDAWARTRSLARTGATTTRGTTGSVPVDPAAVLTTIGAGALPSEHGVTGSIVRSEDGDVVPAWSTLAPPAIVPALGDDLDRGTRQRSRVGVIASSTLDRGLIGGTWYLDGDRDDLVLGGPPVDAVRSLLARGYGRPDDAVDLLGVALDGDVAAMDRATAAIVRLLLDRVPASTIVITATGGADAATDADGLVAAMESRIGAPGLVDAAGVAGLFLDPTVAGARAVSDATAAERLAAAARRAGTDLVSFPAYAVSLRRFC